MTTNDTTELREWLRGELAQFSAIARMRSLTEPEQRQWLWCSSCLVALDERDESEQLLRAQVGLTELLLERARNERDAALAERDRLWGIVTIVLESIDDYELPDPNAVTREWCDRFNTYLRGCVVAQMTMSPEDWAALQAEKPAQDEGE